MVQNKRFKLKISSKISGHLIEAVLIFASVFFAFWLTEYRESRNDKASLEISLQHIASEMKYNHQRAEAIYEYHSGLIHEIDSLKEVVGSGWENLNGDVLKNWDGIQIPLLRSTAYKTFLNSNIVDNAEFKLAKTLADIYNSQSIIERLDNSIFDVVTSGKELAALPRLRHLADVYVGILPDVMMYYQHGRKNWLAKYGYDMPIKNENLKNTVAERLSHAKRNSPE